MILVTKVNFRRGLMVKFQIKTEFNVGIAWLWVKSSFLVFREKPINFMYFGMMYVFMSFLPFLGSFFATAVAMRILMTSAYIGNNEPVGIKLSLPMILRQKNIFTFAIFNTGVDLSELMKSQGVDPSSAAMLEFTPQLAYILIGASIFKALFYGISPAIILFNHELGIWHALRLSWTFIIGNISVIFFAVLLLGAFLLIPLYLFTMLALVVSNVVVFGICFFIMIIIALLAIIISNIFVYNLYATGIVRS